VRSFTRRHLEPGGFDAQSFFLYCDDVDFSWRRGLPGAESSTSRTACVFHDKRLDRDGQVQAGDAEVYYSAEAALMMAWKLLRPDLVDTWSEGLLTTGLPSHTRAVETFRQRQPSASYPNNSMPKGTSPSSSGYAYARHRFAYDDD